MGDLPGFGSVWFQSEGIANVLSFNGVAKAKGYMIKYNNLTMGNYFRVTDPIGRSKDMLALTEGTILLGQPTSIYRKHKNSNGYHERHGENNTKYFDTHKKQTVEPNMIPIPQQIRDHYMEISMGIDIIYINSVPFLTTLSRHVHYGMSQAVRSTKTNDILPVIRDIINFYKKRSFRITTILMDGQFKPLTMSLAGKHIELNIASHNEHVPEAEHYNPTTKERFRCIFSTLPYNKVPKRMIVEMVRNATFYLNAFPWDDGVSNELAPTTSIATGIAPDYSLHFQVAYGTYAQTRDKTDNTMKARNDRCHCHGTDANFPKGRIISRTPSGYTISSMPDKAIQRIERLAHSSCPGLHFTSINNEPDASKNDDNDDSTYSLSSDEEYSSDSSHNDDDPDDHTTPAPAGVTNANVNYEEEPLEEPPLDTNITGVA
eukprot:jgi/Psemu1/21545/gm1.21545_g